MGQAASALADLCGTCPQGHCLCRLSIAVVGDRELISLLLLGSVLGDVAAATKKSHDRA